MNLQVFFPSINLAVPSLNAVHAELTLELAARHV